MRKMIIMLSIAVCGWVVLLPQLQAQDYLSIVKENAEWTVLKITIDTRLPPPPDPIDTSYVTTWIQGDTLIQGFTFKKVFSREFSPGDNMPYYIGAVREENKIVTRIKKGEPLERLDTLYNFNVQVGDTIAYYSHMGDFFHYVQSIDSVLLNDGFKRKRIHIYSKNVGEDGLGGEINTWIEGFGELHYGLIYPFCQEAYAPRCLDGLICYKEGGDVIYESFSLACSTTSVSNRLNQVDITLFPNPFQDVLYVKLPNPISKKFSIKIYNTLGVIMYNKIYNYQSESKIEINLKNIYKGVYFLEISNIDLQILKTIIKQ